MAESKMRERRNPNLPEWFKLDNAASVFPGQNTGTWSNIFRFCMELKEEINPEILTKALENIMPRFPGFDVRIRKGLFWYYFEKNPNIAPDVKPDIQNPCHRVKFKENKGFLFRVYYHGKRIAVDTYHAISDGHGAAIFSCTLVAEYLKLQGHNISSGGLVLDTNEPPKREELEDTFSRIANSKGKIKRSDKYVYHAKGTKLPKHMVNIISGTMSFSDIHKYTKAHGVTITEFFAALLMQVHIEKQRKEEKKQKEVSVQIPIDLRSVYKTETLRNFTICLRAKVDPQLGDYSFEELLKQVAYQLRLANDEKKLNAMVTANMGLERNPVLKFLPLAVKDLGVGISFLITGEQTTSVLLSNLGAVKLPEDMLPFVEKAFLMPGPGIRNAVRCGLATVGDNLVLTIAGIHKETDIEREIFTKLVKMGFHVKIESNRD